jgi:hypothetical protein
LRASRVSASATVPEATADSARTPEVDQVWKSEQKLPTYGIIGYPVRLRQSRDLMSNICPSQTRGDDRPDLLTGLFARRADEPERLARATACDRPVRRAAVRAAVPKTFPTPMRPPLEAGPELVEGVCAERRLAGRWTGISVHGDPGAKRGNEKRVKPSKYTIPRNG